MRHRVRILRFAFTVVASTAIGAGNLAAVGASLTAMSCCVQSHGECAGLKSPDDCCKGMGHGVGASASTTPPIAQTALAASPLAVLSSLVQPAGVIPVTPLTDVSFKRPHDPPHLHPIALLI